jgi:hypothetical protein
MRNNLLRFILPASDETYFCSNILDFGLLCSDIMKSRRTVPMFRRNILPPFSGYKYVSL